jgi:hypothetical protein
MGGKLAPVLCEVNGVSLRLYVVTFINLYLRSVSVFTFANRISRIAVFFNRVRHTAN